MSIKTYKTAVRASAVLAAIALSGGAFATAGISESFEGLYDTEKLSGNGTLTAADVSQPAMGYPIPAANHTTVLEIAGTMTYAEGAAPSSTGASMVDFMFKVEPTDELENPEGDDIRVALAVGTNDVGTITAPIKLWCKPTASAVNPEWVSLGTFDTGTWVRATLVLDYSSSPKKCSVSLNGSPALNAADSSSKWFYFVNSGGTYVSTITMVGSTMVDDFVVSHNASESSLAPEGSSGTIAGDTGRGTTYEYINKYGVTVEQATSSEPLNAKSGMTVAQKFEAGLDPKSDTKFELQTMTTTKSQAVLTFPGANSTARYSIKVKDASQSVITPANATTIVQTGEGEKVNTATVDLTGHENELLYFTVETVAAP